MRGSSGGRLRSADCWTVTDGRICDANGGDVSNDAGNELKGPKGGNDGIGADPATDSVEAVVALCFEKFGKEAFDQAVAKWKQAHDARRPLAVFVDKVTTGNDRHEITLLLRNEGGHGTVCDRRGL
jgi:hypothetical protein